MFLLGYITTKNADSKLYKPINMQDERKRVMTYHRICVNIVDTLPVRGITQAENTLMGG